MRRELAAVGAVAAGAWELQRRVDRKRIRSDPDYAVLRHPPGGGRAVAVPTRDGTELHAEIFGPEDAPTIVLVHGWTCALRFWTYQIRDLARDHRVVAYDLRGHGESRAGDDEDYSIETFGDDLGCVLRACVPAGERAVVAGHSLGAMTLAGCAGRQPHEVRARLAAAMLVNTGLGDLISESMIVRTPDALGAVTDVIGKALLSARAPLPGVSTPLSHRAVRYVALGPGASPAKVAFCERLVLDCRREVRAGAGGTISRLELHDALEHLTVPAVVVAGERDRLTPPVHARKIAEALPELLELVEVPGAGHMIPVEEPGEVSVRLRSLAREHARGTTVGRA